MDQPAPDPSVFQGRLTDRRWDHGSKSRFLPVPHDRPHRRRRSHWARRRLLRPDGGFADGGRLWLLGQRGAWAHPHRHRRLLLSQRVVAVGADRVGWGASGLCLSPSFPFLPYLWGASLSGDPYLFLSAGLFLFLSAGLLATHAATPCRILCRRLCQTILILSRTICAVVRGATLLQLRVVRHENPVPRRRDPHPITWAKC